MKHITAFILFFITILSVNAQVLKPVKWSNEVQKISDQEYVLVRYQLSLFTIL